MVFQTLLPSDPVLLTDQVNRNDEVDELERDRHRAVILGTGAVQGENRAASSL